MNGKRKQHTAEFRFKVALEALKGLKTVSELASIYEVYPTLINRWKKELHEGGRKSLKNNCCWQACLSNQCD
jgi:transposase-like protein